MDSIRWAPGWPGIRPRWTSSAKQGVGTSLSPASPVWFTLSHGIFNEIYYPRVDRACTRDMGMMVTAADGFFSEEKRHAVHEVSMIAPGVPAYALTNTCSAGRYQIYKEILTDPRRDVLLQFTRFTALKGPVSDYRLFILLSPHIGNRGFGNTGWQGDYKGIGMLFAEREGTCMALACSRPWRKRSVGFVGSSDGWQDVSRNKEMTWSWDRAENGNIALTAEIDVSAGQDCVVALGFGKNAAEAANRARSSLSSGFEEVKREYIAEWTKWQRDLSWNVDAPLDLFRVSAATIQVHEAKSFPGGLIASLSIPWGFSKGDDDLGGYHLVWSRDLVEISGGLLAAGAGDAVRRVLRYLESTQEADGHWPQNMWLDGTPYWSGIQMDETALPVLLTDLAMREHAIGPEELRRLWSMVRRASAFIVQNGPVTQQDRWEEDPGYSPFTLAAEISALLCAADIAETCGEGQVADYLRDTADCWNDGIERWTYAKNTDLARRLGVEGYYVRIAPPEVSDAASPAAGFVTIKNRPPDREMERAVHIISPDALALVRFGLRAADDPKIVNTVRVIDALLKSDTPNGPAWHRYNEDRYGEKADGSPFDGTGIGRVWPLITGERAHYELAAGRAAEAEKLKGAMESCAGPGGLLPEQVWDSPDIAGRELYLGKPSGSAMPLLWAHAEYMKLCRSLSDGKVFDTPPQTVKRYIKDGRHSPYAAWRVNHKPRSISRGKTLRVELLRGAVVRWSVDGASATDATTRPTGLGIHVADIPTADMRPGSRMELSIHYEEPGGQEPTAVLLIGP